jgi:hypothetical protein
MIPVLEDILCYHKGVVIKEYVCSKHKYNHLLKLKESTIKCIDCGHFIVSTLPHPGPSTIGMCGLYALRQADGNKRNGCSKFTPKKSPAGRLA